MSDDRPSSPADAAGAFSSPSPAPSTSGPAGGNGYGAAAAAALEAPPPDALLPSAAAAWVAWGERMLDWVNPLTVKETRQALKSQQFLVTFALTLVSVWLVSLFGAGWASPAFGRRPVGGEVFLAYFYILAFTVVVVVPAQAFRSMAGERDGGTYELLQITTLRPWQIVGGKLASAVLQSAVYFSVIAPCIAFTYLLRGIALPTIVLSLGGLALASVGLTILSLAIAAGVHSRMWQMIVQVLQVLLLVWCFAMICAAGSAMVMEMSAGLFAEEEFWSAVTIGVSLYLTYLFLAYGVAAASVTFPSDDRSTLCRAAIFVQFALASGWAGWMLLYGPQSPSMDGAVQVVYVGMTAFHLYVYGVFLTGEPTTLSHRIRRTLPKTFVGRALFLWLRPGSASGFMFCTSLLGAALLWAGGSLFFYDQILGRAYNSNQQNDQLGWFLLGCGAYVVVYLGIGRLIHGLVNRGRVKVASPLIHLFLVVFGLAAPLLSWTFLGGGRSWDPPLLLLSPNPFWVLSQTFGYRAAPDAEGVIGLVSAAALIVFIVNLPGVAKEIRQGVEAVPERVREDDRSQLSAVLAAENRSPWDADPLAPDPRSPDPRSADPLAPDPLAGGAHRPYVPPSPPPPAGPS